MSLKSKQLNLIFYEPYDSYMIRLTGYGSYSLLRQAISGLREHFPDRDFEINNNRIFCWQNSENKIIVAEIKK